MKIGVKTFDDEKFLKHFENDADFFEVMAIQKNDYSFLKNFSLPIVIHAEHQGFGINPADISKKELNLKAVNFAREVADMTNAKKIIVHPGAIEKKNPNCSIKNSINFFREINDDRILIENLPGKIDSEGKRLCQTPHQIRKFINKTKTRFCFDVNHVIQGFRKFNKKYDFIKRYLKLNPAHYHIGGERFINETREHLSLIDSDLNLKEILKFYPKEAEITLETEVDIKKVESDVEIIKNVLKELGK